MNKKKNAITLMQTILIMGIVFLVLFALIAVPFYNSYKQKKSVTTYKTLYATLLQANKMYSFITSSNTDDYDSSLAINVFAEKYFTPYLLIDFYCKGVQNQCWKSPQYKDLKNTKMFNKSLYSIILSDKTVIGFNKNKQDLMTMIVDIDGPAGYNKLGKDVFIFYFYNNAQRPKICDDSVYEKHIIKDGIHYGGYDECGIPHDAYEYTDLIGDKITDGCSKKSKSNEAGLGAGAACGALISKNGWVIDKIYPW